MKVLHNQTKTIIAFLISITFALVLLEISSYIILSKFVKYHSFDIPEGDRNLFIFTNESEHLPYGIKPHFSQRFASPEFDTQVRTNNIGLREDNDFDGRKIDIAFIGDSYTFGHGVDYGERYSDLIAQFNPGLSVFSLSYLNGYAPPHYYVLLDSRPELVPRILILGLYIGNDLQDDIRETKLIYDNEGKLRSVKTTRHANESGALVRANQEKQEPPSHWIKIRKFVFQMVPKNTRNLIRVARARLQGDAQKKDFSNNTPSDFHLGSLDRDALVSLESIRDINNIILRSGGEFIVLLIPEGFQIGTYTTTHNYTPEVQEMLYSGETLQGEIQRWLASHGIKSIDPTPVFKTIEQDGTRLYFQWDAHWTPAGHHAAAVTIQERLQNIGLLP